MKTIPLILSQNHPDAETWLHALQQAMPQFQIVDAAEMSHEECLDIEIVIAGNPNPKDILRFPKLAWVQSLWAGVEQMLAHKSLTQLDIVRLIDPQLADTMAEAALAWTLYLHRDMPAYRQQQNQSTWQALPWKSAEERTVGVLGCGELGMAAIKRLADNGFSVNAWSRSPRELQFARHYHGRNGLIELLSEADILLLLLPLTPTTHHLLNKQSLNYLKPEACLINFGRGALIDTIALLERLNGDQIKHAVLDVFETEPLLPDSPLWSHPSVTVLPHISAPTSMTSASQIVAKNITDWFKHGVKPEAVNRSRGY